MTVEVEKQELQEYYHDFPHKNIYKIKIKTI